MSLCVEMLHKMNYTLFILVFSKVFKRVRKNTVYGSTLFIWIVRIVFILRYMICQIDDQS